jgi:hypothetical protein
VEKKFWRLRKTIKGGVIALASAVLVASVAAACTSIARGSVDHQPHFTITNTISSSATQQNPSPPLPRGPAISLVHRPQPAECSDNGSNMSISSVTPPIGCPTVNLDYSDVFLGLPGGPGRGLELGARANLAHRSPQNQDSCEHKVFQFKFQGTATFSVVASTQTQLIHLTIPRLSANPSRTPQPSFPVVGAEISTIQESDRYRHLPRWLGHHLLECSGHTRLRRDVCGHLHTSRPIWSLALHPITAVFTNTTATSRIRRRRCSIKSSNRRANPPRSDLVAQSVGRRLPRSAHGERFRVSFGPIRSNTNWNCDVLSRVCRSGLIQLLERKLLMRPEKRR